MTEKFHALNKSQRIAMTNAGFLKMEIEAFDKNLSTSFTSEFFQRMIRNRRIWKEAMKLNGWTDTEIIKRLRHWYRMKKKRSPWDFFRLEYDRYINKPTVTKSRFESWYKLREDTSRMFGRAYGRMQSAKAARKYGMPGIPRKYPKGGMERQY